MNIRNIAYAIIGGSLVTTTLVYAESISNTQMIVASLSAIAFGVWNKFIK